MTNTNKSSLAILSRGFTLARRKWPLIVWAYAVNLVFGLLAGMPFTTGLAPLLDHSMGAQKIAGTLDLGTLLELGLQFRDANFTSVGFSAARWLNGLQLLILFLFSVGTVVVYVTGEPARLSTLVRGGLAYFWRFVRGHLIAGCVAALILGGLTVLRAALLERLSQVATGRTLFTYAVASGAVVFLVAMLFRLWLDLVEVCIVRHTLQGELRARRALLPAYKLLLRHFLRLYGGFLLAGFAGAGALSLCLLLWRASPANQVWLAALLAQTGLFFLMAARYWQRGLETELVFAEELAVSPAVVVLEAESVVVAEVPALPVPAAALVAEETVTGLAEPTLMELVQKLRSDPWTRPTEPIPATIFDGRPDMRADVRADVRPDSPLERHAAKYPLGGGPSQSDPVKTTEEEPPPAENSSS